MMINVLSSFSKTKSVASASSFPFFEKDVLRRIGHLISSDLRHLVQNMGSDAGCAENILDGNASNGERVADERTVASPGNGLGAHDGIGRFAASAMSRRNPSSNSAVCIESANPRKETFLQPRFSVESARISLNSSFEVLGLDGAGLGDEPAGGVHLVPYIP